MPNRPSVILLAHGAGGLLSRQLVEHHVLPHLGNPVLAPLLDAALLDGDLALTTDAYVVAPRFFPGGDIGRLAVCGTVNDLWMVGAEPMALTAALILEEGLALAELDRILASMAEAAREARVQVVAGDTKVVPRGACDGVFITTAGLGRRRPGLAPAPGRVRPGDTIIVSGTIGDHGLAVLACREGLSLGGELRSDVAPLGELVGALAAAGLELRCLRDPTRGGVTQALNEIAAQAGLLAVVEERQLPVQPAVRAACELLGLDPLLVANEGKLLALVPGDQSARAVEVLRRHPLGAAAAVIGRIEAPGAAGPGCVLQTTLGARRSLRMPVGELLPRIC